MYSWLGHVAFVFFSPEKSGRGSNISFAPKSSLTPDVFLSQKVAWLLKKATDFWNFSDRQ